MASEVPTDSSAAAALARGGQTNFMGFLLRLLARFPFLVLAARLYGAEELGRFAYAIMVVEFAAALATLGLKRGLAGEMAAAGAGDGPGRPQVHALADAMLLSLLAALGGAAVLVLLPGLMFPDGEVGGWGRWLALMVPLIVLADMALAGLAFRHRIGPAVRARSLIEPWVLTLVATGLAFTAWKGGGLLIAYAASIAAATMASLWPAAAEYGTPSGWRPEPRRLLAIAARNLPLAGADMVEWTTRRLDIFILGRFVSADVVGLYFVAQQVASLAGRIRTSFDPILAPMLSTALRTGRPLEAAMHLRQVGFWVLAFQLPVVLALGLPAEGVLGLFGPAFAVGGMVLALLLASELAAANSNLAEMGLIYARPRANLMIAAGCLALQGGLSLWWVPRFGAEGAAASLLAALAVAAMLRQLVLSRALGTSAGIWRWSLLAAGVVSFLFGLAARQLPELIQMLVTIPGVLLIFGLIMWRWGFGLEDRALFKRLPGPVTHARSAG